jgi:hypothetical protein
VPDGDWNLKEHQGTTDENQEWRDPADPERRPDQDASDSQAEPGKTQPALPDYQGNEEPQLSP